MNTAATPEQRTKRRKYRSQIDKKETEAFLSRPVKKVENLNQSLKKSYEKSFFNKPSFEHFKILKQKRRDKDNDSVASEENEDSQFMLSQSRSSLRESSRSINNTERQSPQLIARKNQKKSKTNTEGSNHDHEDSSSSEEPSPTPNESCSDSSDSQISSEDTNSVKSEESQRKSNAKATKQEDKCRRQFQKQQDQSIRQTVAGNKDKKLPKMPASEQQSSIVNKVQLKAQGKSIKKQQNEPAYLSRGKRTRLSPHIQKALDAKSKNLLQLFQPTEEKPQTKMQEKIEIKQQAMRAPQPKPANIFKRSDRKQLQIVTIKPSTGSNNLSLNSKVIVESVLICSSYAKPQANQQHLSWFSHHFQHAPCCYFRKKIIVEKEQCDEESPKREDSSEVSRKGNSQKR